MTLGDLLVDALRWKRTRGHVFWFENQAWKLRLYDAARASRHPGLICCGRPSVAPGTSNKKAGRSGYGNAFVLGHPDVLRSASSIFFLAFRRYVPIEQFGHYLGQLHEEDLTRLDHALGAERTLHAESER